jgi:solute carrier family 25 protein 34/35
LVEFYKLISKIYLILNFLIKGSMFQLPTYDYTKHYLIDICNFKDNSYTHFCASLIAGLVITVVMNPFDVISSRIMNEKYRGHLYKNPFDCMQKIISNEGFLGLYKGKNLKY